MTEGLERKALKKILRLVEDYKRGKPKGYFTLATPIQLCAERALEGVCLRCAGKKRVISPFGPGERPCPDCATREEVLQFKKEIADE